MKGIRQRAIVASIQRGGIMLLRLQDMPTHEIIAHLCGKMRRRQDHALCWRRSRRRAIALRLTSRANTLEA